MRHGLFLCDSEHSLHLVPHIPPTKPGFGFCSPQFYFIFMHVLPWDPSCPSGSPSEQTGLPLQERDKMGGFDAGNRVCTLTQKCSLQDGCTKLFIGPLFVSEPLLDGFRHLIRQAAPSQVVSSTVQAAWPRHSTRGGLQWLWGLPEGQAELFSLLFPDQGFTLSPQLLRANNPCSWVRSLQQTTQNW